MPGHDFKVCLSKEARFCYIFINCPPVWTFKKLFFSVQTKATVTAGRRGFDINRRIVYAAHHVGRGLPELESLQSHELPVTNAPE